MVTLKNTQVSVPVDVHDSAFRAAQKGKKLICMLFLFQQSDGSAELALLQNR